MEDGVNGHRGVSAARDVVPVSASAIEPVRGQALLSVPSFVAELRSAQGRVSETAIR